MEQLRVLIAEDDVISRRVLQRAVEQAGRTCTATANGNEAWAAFQANAVDVVISDWAMPGLDGLELCRRVREHDAGRYTYFIFLTGLDDKAHAVAGMEAGADDYLNKPLNIDDLQLCLLAATRVTTLHRQLREARLLEGVLLASRTLDHELGNKLAKTVGWADLLAHDPALPPQLLPAATQALLGAEEAIAIVRQLQQVTHIQETEWGPTVHPTIDIPGSVG